MNEITNIGFPLSRQGQAAHPFSSASRPPAPDPNRVRSRAVAEFKERAQANDSTPRAGVGLEKTRLEEMVEDFNRSLTSFTSLRFQLDQQSRKLVVQVVDKETEEVVNQFPSERMVALAKRMEELKGVLFEAVA